MATYKVLQDIEAEDKLVGPLTLRQCIYAAIAAIAGYLSYIFITNGASFMVAFMLPFIAFGLFFAWPWSKQQSTEVWALAKVRFMVKPRKRVWDQSGIKHLVTVTVPRQVVDPRIRKLSETEVRSRLKALADTIDSRGWAVKNVPLDMYIQPTAQPVSDRLVDPASVMPREVPAIDLEHTEDMFDYSNNPVAQQFDAKITAADAAHRQELIDIVEHPESAAAAELSAPTPMDWFMAERGNAPPAASSVPAPAIPTAEEAALIQSARQRQATVDPNNSGKYGHMRIIQPLSAQGQPPAAPAFTPQTQFNPPQSTPMQPDPATSTLPPLTALQQPDPAGAMSMQPQTMQPAGQPVQPSVTPPPNPAILELANNNDLNVATLAREARRSTGADDEVVVSLH